MGGLVAGGLLTAAYAYAPRQNRAVLQVAATVAMIAVLRRRGLGRATTCCSGTFGFYQGRLF